MGKSSSIVVGYWYDMGHVTGWCAGPVDSVRELRAGDLTFFLGELTQSMTLTINRPNLFGGEKKEGGIVGTLDVMMGDADQQPNPYLQAQWGEHVSAMRGKVVMVFRGRIAAMNPYVKAWSGRFSRWVKGWRTPVWLPDLCKVGEGMNGAHFLYRIITDPVTGQGRDAAAAIDLDRHAEAAQTMFDEGLGLCLKWSRSDALSNFTQILCDHVGGTWADDPTTGKEYLQLFRGDYDVNALPVIDESNITDFTSFEPPALSGTVNQVTVTFHDCVNNKDVNVTVTNTANAQAQGRIINQATNYPGAWNFDIGSRLAMRDLKTASSLPVRMELTVQSPLMAMVNGVLTETEIRKGKVLALSWGGRYQLDRMPVRILEIDRGWPGDNAVKLTLAQDVFGLPNRAYVRQQPPKWTEPDLSPQPLPAQELIESSYRDLASRLRAADLAALDAGAAFIGSLGARSSKVAYNYTLTTRVGTSGAFREVASGEFTPTGLIGQAMTVEAGPTTVPLTSFRDLDQVVAGSEVKIDSEYLCVTAISPETGVVTLARGCVDSAPAAHAVGARIWFTDEATATDLTEYVSGEMIQAQLLTRTGQGELDPANAAVVSIALQGRQYRPYPPGNLTVHGAHYPTDVFGPLVLAWSHRDRLLQADQLIDTTQGNIGPEPGTTYTVRIYVDGVLDGTPIEVDGTTVTPAVSKDGIVRVEIFAVRDGLASLQPLAASFTYTSGEPRVTEDGDIRITEAGETRITEA